MFYLEHILHFTNQTQSPMCFFYTEVWSWFVLLFKSFFCSQLQWLIHREIWMILHCSYGIQVNEMCKWTLYSWSFSLGIVQKNNFSWSSGQTLNKMFLNRVYIFCNGFYIIYVTSTAKYLIAEQNLIVSS